MDWIRRRRSAEESQDTSDDRDSTSRESGAGLPAQYDATYVPTQPDATHVPGRPDATHVPDRPDATHVPIGPDAGYLPTRLDAPWVPSQPDDRPESAHRDPRPAKATGPQAWRLGDWDQPDLMYAEAFASLRYRDWPFYIPQLELVPCAGLMKPALFLKVGGVEFSDWSATVVPKSIFWNWLHVKRDKPYVLLQLSVLFENTNGQAIGVWREGLVTTTSADLKGSHRLTCNTMLDPADRQHCEAVEAWAQAPAPAMLFFVNGNNAGTSYLSLNHKPTANRVAAEKLREAQQQLRDDPVNVPGGYIDARAFAEKALPPISYW